MSNMPETNVELLELARNVSIQNFCRPFLHDCRFNSRLRSIGGRYLLQSHDIEINWRYALQVGWDGLIDTIKHELCHYHLHMTGKGYRHRDKDFQLLLARVNGVRYADRSALHLRAYRYEYLCQSCGTKYLRRNRMNVKKFVCGKCKGKLHLMKANEQSATEKGDVLH